MLRHLSLTSHHIMSLMNHTCGNGQPDKCQITLARSKGLKSALNVWLSGNRLQRQTSRGIAVFISECLRKKALNQTGESDTDFERESGYKENRQILHNSVQTHRFLSTYMIN